MDFNAIVQLITAVGFPIVACLGMALFVSRQITENNTRIDKLNESHKEEIEKVTDALNSNTLAIQKLCDKLTGGMQ